MKVELALIVDESGSMGGKQEIVISGVNNFLREQREAPGEAKVTIAKFSYNSTFMADGSPLNVVGDWSARSYSPDGGTALFDAVGYTMNKIGARIQSDPVDKVIVCIITDGQENSSREFTQAKIKEMITHAEKNGWVFVYLGADINSAAHARSMGVQGQNTVLYANTAVGTQTAYATASGMTRAFREEPQISKTADPATKP